jgi:Zn-dependent protease
LGLVVLALSRAGFDLPPLARLAITYGLYVNFVWTLVNLLPISPLDGGQILAQVLGPRRVQLTSWIGFVVAGALCLWTLSNRQIFSAFMLAMLAYYNFRREPVEGGVITP